MKTSEIELWCNQLQLKNSTRNFPFHLRSSPPARRVQNRLLNMTGIYASHKMGVGIQSETISNLHSQPRLFESLPSKQQKARKVSLVYQRACLEQHVQPLSKPTFYRYVNMRSSPALTEQRKGARAAYQESTWHCKTFTL